MSSRTITRSFRRYYGLRRHLPKSTPFGAVAGVLGTVTQMLEQGATHIGVATDHIIESFHNELWPGYKTGEGIEPELHAQLISSWPGYLVHLLC